MVLPLCVRTEASDARSAAALTAEGWRPIETLETWQSRARNWPFRKRPFALRAIGSDLTWIAELAAESFTHDRLHADGLVAKVDADASKAEWVRAAFETHGTEIWVPDARFAFLIMRGEVIDLICVRASARRKGIAGRLIKCAVSGRRMALTAGTQSTNKPAQALYSSLGMAVVRQQTSWHKP